ncbi:uncharacterized protein LOC105440235 [Strongylocentrotus purpuratus]|uniref:Death domain-containing protein n=2 Tax=Strongylocentrotus purpuratus TaxID=7668 RepID=A0A7M7NF14_STRPU|nr:uncharacterized protein LOC105440235 [Strongylocentrotus purpuratus]
MGKVSFFELWYLVHAMDETNLNALRHALIDLSTPGVDEELTADKAYDLLCDWKDENRFHNEGMRLKDVLHVYGLDCSWNEICERRYDVMSAVSEELLDHVLRSIGDKTKICRFLRELIPEKRETRPNVSGNKGEVIEECMVVLREWRDKEHNVRQVIQLSLALERARCKPLERTFFQVPEHLLKAISPQEVEGFVYRLTERHCKRLAKAVGITDENRIATIMDENNEDLVLIQSMVNDWIDGQECCNFEKRCRLDDATIKIGRHDLTDSFGTTSFRVETGGIFERPHPRAETFNSSSIFDDDLASVLKHLPTCATPLFLEKLGISVDEQGDDLKKLRCWRDQNINESNRHTLQDLVLIHSYALKETNDSHGNCLKIDIFDVSDDELENLIGSMTSRKQVEELTSRLGIKLDKEQSPLLKLKEWRNKCNGDERRETLRKALHAMELSGCIVDHLPAKHVDQAELVRLAWTLFSIDVWPLATLLDIDINKGKTVGEPQMRGTVHLLNLLLEKSKGLDEHRRRDFCVAIRNLGYLDVARSGYFGYDASLSELCNMTSGLSEAELVKFVDHLGLEKDVLSICQGTTGAYDNLKLMKVWRNQLRLQPLHFRFELAVGLRAVGRTEIASKILAGRHHTNEVGSSVVESICNILENDKMKRLREHLRLKTRDDQSPTTVTPTLMTEWVRNWLEEFENISVMKLFMDKIKCLENTSDNESEV